MWTKGGKPVKKDKRHEIVSDGVVHRLTIKDVTDADLLEYTVHIVDTDKSASAKLVVSGGYLTSATLYCCAFCKHLSLQLDPSLSWTRSSRTN